MQGGLDPEKWVNYSSYQVTANKYFFASQFVRGKRVLEVGCGRGYGTSYLAGKGAASIVGGDMDGDGIKYAQARYGRTGSGSFVRIDASYLPFRNGSFDLVVCFDIAEHLRDYERHFDECSRVLGEDGLFICATPNRDAHYGWAKPPYHVHEFSLVEMNLLLGKRYSQVVSFGQILIRSDRLRWERLQGAVAVTGSRVLLRVPFGEKARRFLNRTVLRDNRAVEYRAEFDASRDPRFAVRPLRDFEGGIPRRLVLVAGKGGRDISPVAEG
jgi:SAM-dependent methyltransferase